jgi:hypothetical protein
MTQNLHCERSAEGQSDGESDSITVALEQCELGLDLDVACLQVLAKRLLETTRHPNEPPVQGRSIGLDSPIADIAAPLE